MVVLPAVKGVGLTDVMYPRREANMQVCSYVAEQV